MSEFRALATESQQSAQESLEEIIAPFNTIGNRIVLNPKYVSKHRTSQAELMDSLNVSNWHIAPLDSHNQLVGMGTTHHAGLPVVAPGYGKSRELGLFVKPQDIVGARLEYRNANMALERGVPNPQMVGRIENSDTSTALIITELIPSAEPLSVRRFDYVRQDPRIYPPRAFLIDFLLPIAEAHEKGIAFGDLHLGNIGYRHRTGQRPGKIFFDLETAMVLEELDLSMKKKGQYSGNKRPPQWQQFERLAIEDVSTFFANLNNANFAMPDSELLQFGWDTYSAFRTHPVSIQIPDDEARGILYHTYLKTLFSFQDHLKKNELMKLPESQYDHHITQNNAVQVEH